MATKEQERKALEKIKKIVYELGEESYIGTAFLGCFEIAERNIENDWWDSLNEYVGKCQILEQKLGSLEDERKKLYSELGLQKDWVKSLKEQREGLTADIRKLEAKSDLFQAIIEDRNLEIIQLKAQLYDMIKKGE